MSKVFQAYCEKKGIQLSEVKCVLDCIWLQCARGPASGHTSLHLSLQVRV